MSIYVCGYRFMYMHIYVGRHALCMYLQVHVSYILMQVRMYVGKNPCMYVCVYIGIIEFDHMSLAFLRLRVITCMCKL